jgi:hypothetical protein
MLGLAAYSSEGPNKEHIMPKKRGENWTRIFSWLVLAALMVAAPRAVSAQAQEEETFLLLFPFFFEDEASFSGYGLLNHSPDPVLITIEGFDDTGQLIAFPENPAQESLDSQNQLTLLGSELFGDEPTRELQGWIRMSSDSPDLAGFFQLGNGLEGRQTRMDGTVALTEQSRVLFFTRVHEGPASFPNFGLFGPKDATTFLSIVNPNDEPISLTLNLLNITGANIAQTQEVELPALGRLFDTVSGIFNQSLQVATATVRVDVEGPGAAGLELIVVEDSVLALNASPGSEASTLYSAQLVSGLTENGGIFSSLKLVNTTQELRAVNLRAFSDDGVEFASSVLVIQPGGSFQGPVHLIFPAMANPTSDLNLVVGSIVAEVEGGGVIGDVIFGDPGDNATGTPEIINYAAALPLQETLFTEALFMQVANGSLDPDEPEDSVQDLFTRLVLFNPNDEPADLTIKAFDSLGNLVGEARPRAGLSSLVQPSLSLGPGERLDQLVEDLIPESADQIGGFIQIESTQPLTGHEVVGNEALDYTSALPPTVVESAVDSVDPDDPVDPVDRVDPVDSVDRLDPVDRPDPVDPVDRLDPVDRPDPVESPIRSTSPRVR